MPVVWSTFCASRGSASRHAAAANETFRMIGPPEEECARIAKALLVRSDPPHADCDTLIAVPATFTTPLRAAPLFAETENVSVPLPLPLGFEVSVIHGVGVDALQTQLPLAVMVIIPLPPVGSNVNDIGEAA